jgi:hypothetical protein
MKKKRKKRKHKASGIMAKKRPALVALTKCVQKSMKHGASKIEIEKAVDRGTRK